MLRGKQDPKHRYAFPLWFDEPDVLLDAVSYYSWLDDYRYGDDERGKILTDPDSDLKPVAICDCALSQRRRGRRLDGYTFEMSRMPARI